MSAKVRSIELSHFQSSVFAVNDMIAIIIFKAALSIQIRCLHILHTSLRNKWMNNIEYVGRANLLMLTRSPLVRRPNNFFPHKLTAETKEVLENLRYLDRGDNSIFFKRFLPTFFANDSVFVIFISSGKYDRLKNTHFARHSSTGRFCKI